MAVKQDSNNPKILIAGLGNELLMDDGVGVHAVHELQKDTTPDVIVVEIGTAVLDALHLLEWADKILAIDAVKAGGAPGSFYMFDISQAEEAGPDRSMHELNLLAAFNFIPDAVRPEITILGVEPEVIDYGMELSPTVQETLPRLVETARRIVKKWQEKPAGG